MQNDNNHKQHTANTTFNNFESHQNQPTANMSPNPAAAADTQLPQQQRQPRNKKTSSRLRRHSKKIAPVSAHILITLPNTGYPFLAIAREIDNNNNTAAAAAPAVDTTTATTASTSTATTKVSTSPTNIHSGANTPTSLNKNRNNTLASPATIQLQKKQQQQELRQHDDTKPRRIWMFAVVSASQRVLSTARPGEQKKTGKKELDKRLLGMSDNAICRHLRSTMRKHDIQWSQAVLPELVLLKKIGLIGARSPNASMISSEDMCRLLKLYGRTTVALELQRELAVQVERFERREQELGGEEHGQSQQVAAREEDKEKEEEDVDRRQSKGRKGRRRKAEDKEVKPHDADKEVATKRSRRRGTGASARGIETTEHAGAASKQSFKASNRSKAPPGASAPQQRRVLPAATQQTRKRRRLSRTGRSDAAKLVSQQYPNNIAISGACRAGPVEWVGVQAGVGVGSLSTGLRSTNESGKMRSAESGKRRSKRLSRLFSSYDSAESIQSAGADLRGGGSELLLSPIEFENRYGERDGMHELYRGADGCYPEVPVDVEQRRRGQGRHWNKTSQSSAESGSFSLKRLSTQARDAGLVHATPSCRRLSRGKGDANDVSEVADSVSDALSMEDERSAIATMASLSSHGKPLASAILPPRIIDGSRMKGVVTATRAGVVFPPDVVVMHPSAVGRVPSGLVSPIKPTVSMGPPQNLLRGAFIAHPHRLAAAAAGAAVILPKAIASALPAASAIPATRFQA